VMIAVVCLWGLLFPILAGALGGGASGVDAAFFNKWNYPFVLVFVASIIGCHLSSRLSAMRYAGILIALLATGLGAAFLGFPTSNMLANLGIPFVLFASGAVVYSTWETVSRRKNRVVPLGRNLLHLGVTLVVLGVLIGSSSVTDYGEISTSPGTIVNLGGLIFEFGDFSIIGPLGRVHTFTPEACCVPEAVGLQIPVVVAGGGSSMRGDLKILLYTNHGVVSRPLILRDPGRDVYLVLHQSEEVYLSLGHATMGAPLPPSEFLVSVRVFPMLNLLWLGVLSMAVGILLPFLSPVKNQYRGKWVSLYEIPPPRCWSICLP